MPSDEVFVGVVLNREKRVGWDWRDARDWRCQNVISGLSKQLKSRQVWQLFTVWILAVITPLHLRCTTYHFFPLHLAIWLDKNINTVDVIITRALNVW